MGDAPFEKLCGSSGIFVPRTIREIEEYQIELSDVTVLELVIVSDRSRGVAHASLKSLRLS